MKDVATPESRPTCTLGQHAWAHKSCGAHNHEDTRQVLVELLLLFLILPLAGSKS